MSRRKHFCSALILAALVLAGRVSADPALEANSTPVTNHLAYNAALHGGETIGDRQIQRVFLTAGTNQFAFIVPTDFRTDASNPQRITLTDKTDIFSSRSACCRQRRWISQSAYFRGLALNRFPGAKISEESSEFAGSHSGRPSTCNGWVTVAARKWHASRSFRRPPGSWSFVL